MFIVLLLKPERDPKTGKILRYEEVFVDPTAQCDDDLIPCLKSVNSLKVDTQLEDNVHQLEFDPSM